MSKHIGPIRVALYAARRGSAAKFADVEAGKADWIAPGRCATPTPFGGLAQALFSQGVREHEIRWMREHGN
ncbi:hypothetical protein [Cupriavidus basilensis]|uniref:hypothetical protein n=1 Tax=Cupriavidus basilensis TaxID=68895 RepID=UPI003F51D9F6